MRVTVTRGANTATAEIDGASPKLLRQVEETLRRLLADPVEPAAKFPFGFVGDPPKPAGCPKHFPPQNPSPTGDVH